MRAVGNVGGPVVGVEKDMAAVPYRKFRARAPSGNWWRRMGKEKPARGSRLRAGVLVLAACLVAETWPSALGAGAATRSGLYHPPHITFNDPGGLRLDAHGDLYVADGNGNDIIKLSPAGTVLARWGNPPGYVNWIANKPPPAGIFTNVSDVAVSAGGVLYVADTKDFRIQELSSHGRPLRMWGTQGTAPGQFGFPVGVALDRRGNVYVVDSGDSRIQKFTPTGKLLALWRVRGIVPGHPAAPVGIAVDGRGTVFVTDDGANRVDVFSPEGRLLARWGRYGKGPGEFDQPGGIAVDRGDGVYIADKLNHRIEKFTAAGTLLRSWGRYGMAPGQMRYPSGVAVDRQGNVYVADGGNRRIEKFTASGKLLAVWP